MKHYFVKKTFSNLRIGKILAGTYVPAELVRFLGCEEIKNNILVLNYEYESPWEYGLVFESKTYPFISVADEESRCEMEKRMECEMIKYESKC